MLPRQKQPIRSSLFVSIATNVILGLICLLIGAATKRVVNGYPVLQLQIGPRAAHWLLGVGIMLTGIGAFVFKQKWLYGYGVVETVLGLYSCFTVAFSVAVKPAPSQWVTLVGCAYFVARGLNNLSDARKKRMKP